MGDQGDHCASESSPPEGGGENVFLSKDVLTGVPWTVASKLSMTVVMLAISVLTVRLLGPKEYGILSLCKTIADTLLLICGLGLGTAMVRFIPELCVQRNRVGLIRLLIKSTTMQAGMLAFTGCVLYFGRGLLGRWLGIDLDGLLLLTMLLTVARLSRGFLEACLTSLYRVRANSILSVIQGFLYLGCVVTILSFRGTAGAALLTEGLPVLLIAGISGYVLVRTVASLRGPSPPYGVGKRRVLGMAMGSLLNSFAMLFLRQYSEIFFLGYYYSKEIVGYYSLGCGLPLMLISLLPTAIQNLFTAGFAEAHSRDPNSIPRIIAVFYHIIIVMVVPFSAFGLFFAARAVTLIYGVNMTNAGPVTSFFCVLHVLPLISLPLSMAIVAREKMMHVQPLMIMQVVVNLILDYVLIPPYGMYGAMAAVLITFVATIPIRLYVVARFVGGINFPMAFFIKFVLWGFGLAAAMGPLARFCNIPILAAVGAAYGVAYFCGIRLLHLIKPEDFAELRGIGLAKLNKGLDLITGQ